MREVLRSRNPVEVDVALNLLSQEGIQTVPLQHDNNRETLPTQIFVADEDFARAAHLLRTAMPDTKG